MIVERALEILAAYGADAARWPDDERAGVLALADHDPAVKAALDEVRGLDGLLAGWASDVPLRQFDAAALVPVQTTIEHTKSGFVPGKMRWAGGALVAASLALVVVLMPASQPAMMTGQDAIAEDVSIANVPLGSASDIVEPMDGFAMIFTPTADEEDAV